MLTQRSLFFLVRPFLLWLALAAWMPPAITAHAQSRNLVQYVNPFLGTAPGGSHFGFSGNSGDVFPGAAVPYGMVQWSPDTPSNIAGGYHYPDSTIKGFGLTHFSGRGCTAYEDVPFLPVIGPITSSPATNPSAYRPGFAHSNESAEPGYYKVHLNTNIDVELTVTTRSGMGRFTYPPSTNATLLINTGGSVNGNSSPGTGVTIVGNNQVTGSATGVVGCGTEKYTLYFAARFDRPFTSFGTWNGGTVTAGSRSSTGAQSGAYVIFDATQNGVVQAKVGLSYVSVTNAQMNLDSENSGWDFEAVRTGASAAWNAVLNRIQVDGGTLANTQTFYTALYHTFFHPNVFNDVNGQYIGFDQQIHTAIGYTHYENIPAWDQYRSLIPLRALLAPAETGDILQSLVVDAQQGGGGLPRWEQTSRNSGGMVGDHSDAILASAYAFGIRNFDAASALQAMVVGASQPNAHSDDRIVRDSLSDYLLYGYIPGTGYIGTAVTLDYAIDDFCIAQFAHALGDTATYKTYLNRAQNWRHLYNPASGYIQPRNADGSWVSGFNPASQNGFVEGSAAQYRWMVPFNLRGLFSAMGGTTPAVQQLDVFFTLLNEGPDSLYAFMGNEPCFEVPWEYDFAGAPSHTQEVVRRIQTQLFNPTPNGLPGNDDGGAMSAWYIFSAIGLYPEIPGVGGFVVGSPLFPRIILDLPGSNPIQILGLGASDATPYVQSLRLNGQPYNSPWIPFALLQNGATLEFTLDANPTAWGSDPAAAPPSFDLTTVSGTITLQGCVNSVQPITFQFRPTDGSAAFTQTATLDANGAFTLTDIPTGTYMLWIKGEKWLARAVPVDASNGSVSGLTATLLAGDVTNHNAVTTADYLALKAAFGSVPGDPNWNSNADLNCDGVVSTADYLLLKSNFGQMGDL